MCVSGVVGYFATCVSYYDPIVEFSMQECIMFVPILSHSEVSYTMQQMAASEQTGSFFLTVF